MFLVLAAQMSGGDASIPERLLMFYSRRTTSSSFSSFVFFYNIFCFPLSPLFTLFKAVVMDLISSFLLF